MSTSHLPPTTRALHPGLFADLGETRVPPLPGLDHAVESDHWSPATDGNGDGWHDEDLSTAEVPVGFDGSAQAVGAFFGGFVDTARPWQPSDAAGVARGGPDEGPPADAARRAARTQVDDEGEIFEQRFSRLA